MNINSSENINPFRLKQARISRGYSLADLADRIGVTKQYISQCELGITNASNIIYKLCDVLNYPISFFSKPTKAIETSSATYFRSRRTTPKKLKEAANEKVELFSEVKDFFEEFVNYPKLNLPKDLELKDEYTKKGELDKAYMLDCITNELLMKLYVEFNNMYSRFHRRYVKRYVFIGEEITTEKIPDIIEDIKGNTSYNVEIGSMDMNYEECVKDDFIVSANKYGVMEPTKSVVFYALLTENPNQICEGICDNCNNKNCENNPLYVEETDEE